jgi:enoyl-CoA hydratase
MSDRVRLDRDGSIATVVLDRPDKMNVLDLRAWQVLGELIEEVAGDESVRCVVLRGMGSRAFSAGSDISSFPVQRQTPDEVEVYGRAMDRTLTAIWDCPVPTIAMIRGACVGGGLEIAACCDLRICSEESRFGAPIARLGLTMSHAELRPLYRALGGGTVLEILLEGAIFGATRAHRMGIVQRVVPEDQIEREGRVLAERVAAGAPLVHRWHKKFIRQLQDDAELDEKDIAEGYAAFETEDYVEGVRAFLEKRDPHFRAR